jgi:hypothetical protein
MRGTPVSTGCSTGHARRWRPGGDGAAAERGALLQELLPVLREAAEEPPSSSVPRSS